MRASVPHGSRLRPVRVNVKLFAMLRERAGADSVEVFSSMSQGGGLMDSHTRSYGSGIANHFGMLGFWANSDTFGSSNTAGNPDNGITFSNIKVEVVKLEKNADGYTNLIKRLGLRK